MFPPRLSFPASRDKLYQPPWMASHVIQVPITTFLKWWFFSELYHGKSLTDEPRKCFKDVSWKKFNLLPGPWENLARNKGALSAAGRNPAQQLKEHDNSKTTPLSSASSISSPICGRPAHWLPWKPWNGRRTKQWLWSKNTCQSLGKNVWL